MTICATRVHLWMLNSFFKSDQPQLAATVGQHQLEATAVKLSDQDLEVGGRCRWKKLPRASTATEISKLPARRCLRRISSPRNGLSPPVAVNLPRGRPAPMLRRLSSIPAGLLPWQILPLTFRTIPGRCSNIHQMRHLALPPAYTISPRPFDSTKSMVPNQPRCHLRVRCHGPALRTRGHSRPQDHTRGHSQPQHHGHSHDQGLL